MKRITLLRNVFFFFLILGLLLLVLFLPAVYYFSDFLTKNKPVEANLLVVEGWLPEYAIKMAAEEYHRNDYDFVITTGVKLPEFFPMYNDGFLIFHLNKSDTTSQIKEHTISVKTSSPFDGILAAHYNIWINDTLAAEFHAGRKPSLHSFSWEGDLSLVDSVIIQFDNDAVLPEGDRNLFVFELNINSEKYLPWRKNVVFDLYRHDGRQVKRYSSDSYATAGRMELISYGIDPSKIIAVTGEYVHNNRTLNSVIAFRSWLINSEKQVDGINIISLGPHSRRTWITYKKLLSGELPVGIIALPDLYSPHSRKYAIKPLLREAAGYLWYRVILIPGYKIRNKDSN